MDGFPGVINVNGSVQLGRLCSGAGIGLGVSGSSVGVSGVGRVDVAGLAVARRAHGWRRRKRVRRINGRGDVCFCWTVRGEREEQAASR